MARSVHLRRAGVAPLMIREIRLGGGDGGGLRIEPRPSGASVVPVSEPIEAETLARAIRETIGAPRRLALRDLAPVLEIHLADGSNHALIQDDARYDRRSFVLRPAAGPEVVTEAETHPLADVFVKQRLLLRIARAFDLDTAADLLPALAHGAKIEGTSASPKRLAYQRSFEEMRAIAKNLESLDRSLMQPTRPNWLFVAAIVGGSAFGGTVLALLIPSLAGITLGLTTLGLLAFLGRVGLRSLREIEGKKRLPTEMLELQAALEAARERCAELAETLRRRGEDPEEVLDGLVRWNHQPHAPSVLARTSTSSAELLALEMAGHQALVFVPAHNVGGDDFGGRVRRPEGLSSELPPALELAGE